MDKFQSNVRNTVFSNGIIYILVEKETGTLTERENKAESSILQQIDWLRVIAIKIFFYENLQPFILEPHLRIITIKFNLY